MKGWQRIAAKLGFLFGVGLLLPLAVAAQQQTAYLAGKADAFSADYQQTLSRRMPALQWLDDATSADSIVAIGDAAFTWALTQDKPVLGIYISRSLSEKQPDDCQCSAIWAGVAVDSQLQVVRTLMPGVRRLGVVVGPHSAWSAAGLADSGKGLDIHILSATDPDSLGPLLREALPRLDALMLPVDKHLFSAQTAKLVLLTSYRQRIPVFGPDRAFVNAGSAASRYPSGADLVAASVERLQHFFTEGAWPESGFAGSASLRVNEHVAGSFNLRYRDSQSLQQALEEKP